MKKIESSSLVNVIVNGFDNIKQYLVVKSNLLPYGRLFGKVLEDGHCVICIDKVIYILEANEYEVID